MARKRIPAYKKREYLAAYVMSAPVVLGTVVFFLIPALWSFWLSFTSGPDYFNNTFVGLENYRQLFTADENLRYELFNTFYYAIVVVVLAVVLGVLLANALIAGVWPDASFVLLIAELAVGLFLIHRRYKALLAKYSSTEPRA